MRHTFEKHNPGSANGIDNSPYTKVYYNSDGTVPEKEGLPIPLIIAGLNLPIDFIGR